PLEGPEATDDRHRSPPDRSPRVAPVRAASLSEWQPFAAGRVLPRHVAGGAGRVRRDLAGHWPQEPPTFHTGRHVALLSGDRHRFATRRERGGVASPARPPCHANNKSPGDDRALRAFAALGTEASATNCALPKPLRPLRDLSR